MCKFKCTTETKQIQLSYFLPQKKLCVERHRTPSDTTMVTPCHPHICAITPGPPLSMPSFWRSPVFAYDLHSEAPSVVSQLRWQQVMAWTGDNTVTDQESSLEQEWADRAARHRGSPLSGGQVLGSCS